MTDYVFNGNTYNTRAYDAVTNPGGLDEGGFRTNLLPMLEDVLEDVAVAGQMSSATSLAIGTGSKTFTVGTFREPVIGEGMYAVYDATHYMWGTVSAYDADLSTVTIDVTVTNLTGTYAAWTLKSTGPRGATGATGADYTANAALVAVAALSATPGAALVSAFFTFTDKSANFAASAYGVYRCTATLTATFATLTAGQWIVMARDTASGIPSTARNSQTINGVADDLALHVDKQIVLFLCTASGEIKTYLLGAMP